MTAQERMVRGYDRALTSTSYREYYEDSGYYNFGCWSIARSQKKASEGLVDVLVDKIQVKGGRILDVACGPGATTERLLENYWAENIIVINISKAQLAYGRRRAPDCEFLSWTPRGLTSRMTTSTG